MNNFDPSITIPNSFGKNNHLLLFIGPFNFTLNGHGYFYSGWVEEHKSDKVDWLEARNTCREYCMDLVSLETPTEDEMIKEFLTKGREKNLYLSG